MKNSDINLPTPEMLMSRAKEETVPVSLRVKESTLAVFDKMAKEAGVKTGSMMNTWLDYYAQNYRVTKNTSDDENAKDIMISYLNSERFWGSIPKLSTEELIYRLNSKGMIVGGYDYVDVLYSDYVSGKYDDMVTFLEEQGGCAFTVGISDEPDYKPDGLYVTAKQWPLVSVLLNEYSRKFKRLFPDRLYYATPKVFEEIVKKCKEFGSEKPDSVFATRIKSVLLLYVENMDD